MKHKLIFLVLIIVIITSCKASDDEIRITRDEYHKLLTRIDILEGKNTELQEKLLSIIDEQNMNNDLSKLVEEDRKLSNQINDIDRQISSLTHEYSNFSRVEWILRKLPDLKVVLGYINSYSKTEGTLVINEIEWITREERLKELGLQEVGMPSGFYIHDAVYEEDVYLLAVDTNYYMLEGSMSINVNKESFFNYIDNDKYNTPFEFYIIDGKIIEVHQRYIP